MTVSKILNVFLIVLLLSVFNSCADNELEIKNMNYKYFNDMLAVSIEMKNTSECMLLFPGSMRNQIRQLKNDDAEIVLNECKLDFKNAKEMMEFEKNEISLDDEKHTDEFSSLYINPVYPEHQCVYEGFINYKEISKEEIEKKKITIILKYGKSLKDESEAEDYRKLKTDGKIYSKKFVLKLPKEKQTVKWNIPDVIYWPVWDTEKWPSNYGERDLIQYVPETYYPSEE